MEFISPQNIIGILALIFTWITIKRDDPKLSFTIGFYKFASYQETKLLIMDIVNTGKRTVPLKLMGGDLKWQLHRKIINHFFRKVWKPTSAIIPFPEVIEALKDDAGKPKTLKEGELLPIYLNVSIIFIKNFRKQLSDFRNIYVLDGFGKKHYCDKRAFLILLDSLQDHIENLDAEKSAKDI